MLNPVNNEIFTILVQECVHQPYEVSGLVVAVGYIVYIYNRLYITAHISDSEY